MRGVCFHGKLTTDLLFFIFLKKIKVDTHFPFFFLFCFFIFLCPEKKKSNIGFHISEKKKTNNIYFIFHIRLFRKNIKVEANCQFLFSIFYIEKKENLTQILIFQLMTLTYTHLSCFLNHIWQRCRCIYLYLFFTFRCFSWSISNMQLIYFI